ncbi:MAG: hypothetical protein GXO77_13455 [Calditrichaeota bacterium]|nr:hypothetical protein [Calditrichota bacterium]
MNRLRFRQIIIPLLSGFLLILTSVGGVAHNHPIWQGENNSCPAYILNNTVNFEQAPGIDFSPVLLQSAEIIQYSDDYPAIQSYFYPFDRRGPPVLFPSV